MCYRHLTLTFTTVDIWLGLSKIVTPQKPNQDWQVSFPMLLMKTGVLQGCKFLKIDEQTQSPYLDWGNMWGCHTQRQWMLRKAKPPCTKLTMLKLSYKKECMKLCYFRNVVVVLVQLCHYKTVNLLNLNHLLQSSNALGSVYLND